MCLTEWCDAKTQPIQKLTGRCFHLSKIMTSTGQFLDWLNFGTRLCSQTSKVNIYNLRNFPDIGFGCLTFTNMPITFSILIHYRADKYPIEYTYIPKVSDIYRRHSAATAPPGGGTIYIYWPAKHGFSNVGHEKNIDR